ncbi:TetR/AcrR family transcriptional regulator [Saccharopolyspora sp. 5N708]|uniref:TetR/AcrR family transcriptional regulator n=1 Tax=Saccharopolyspora sp. 5N708 TaxID=3457424 RepID=UPI003FD04035
MVGHDPDAAHGAPPKRKRNAAATREAILRSAHVAFTRHGYDGVGVREIAQAAGVTAMLVNRYFGSKEQLFAEVVDVAFAPRSVVTDDPATLSRDVAELLVAKTAPEAEQLDPYLLMLRSAGNPRSAEIIRAGIERHVERHLTEVLPGKRLAERAELFLSLIAGFWLMRRILGTRGLQRADSEDLVRSLAAMFQPMVEPCPGESSTCHTSDPVDRS